jgi:hypothetical protein
MPSQTAANVRTNNLGRSLTLRRTPGPSRSAAPNIVAKVATPESSIKTSNKESTSFRLNILTCKLIALSNRESRINGCDLGTRFVLKKFGELEESWADFS